MNSYIVIGEKGAQTARAMEGLIETGSPKAPNIELEDEDEGALYFTSGTTGTPKPVLIQHKSIMCAAVTEAMNHALARSDRFLMMPPMYHVAITHMFGVMAAGGCSVLLTEQITAQAMVNTIAKEHISVAFLSCRGPWTSWRLSTSAR